MRHESGLDQVVDFLAGSPLVPTLLGTPGTEPPQQHPHLPGDSGRPNYLRGPYETMYLTRPWTIRQYAGFSTAAESNAFYRKNLAAGQKGLSVAFDLPTHRGYDSDHPAAVADVGKAGVAIDSVEDMKALFDGIPLDRMSVSMTMNGAVIPIMAFYIVAAEESGVAMKDLSGTIQNDILKEFMVRNTYIYPPEASLRLTGDVMAFTSVHMPRFNSISVSGYHMHEAGAPAALELAYTLANGAAYLEEAIGRGLHVDEVAPRVSFFWAIGMHTLTEIAKLRAARVLWHEIVSKYHPNNPKSTALRTHCQTSGWSLTAQDPVNNITRTAFEALSAALGHTQSLHTNALDEAIALPTVETARIARQTQQYLIEHAGLTDMIDPLGGSHVLEAETAALIEAARGYMDEVSERGGMAKAIALGIPKRRIEEAATEKQARIDQGAEVIVGVNAYRSDIPEVRPTLRIDHNTVFAYQQERLQAVKNERDHEAVSAALEQLTRDVAAGENVLPAAIAAARVRATLGEISEAIERVAGRHQAHNEPVRGVFAKAMQEDHAYHTIHAEAAAFEVQTGRRPRILVAKLGQDGHDRGARIIASSFADMGFDVDVGPLFQTPAEVVRQAVDNDVHLIGISSLAGAHRTLVPEVLTLLAQMNRSDIRVIVGGVIPPEDYAELTGAGVAAVFGPGTNLIEAASALLRLLSD
ncbi:MAG: methylmalonyl-CoA mutase [Bacteroidetes bacterium]|nr:methylmalonyl-CoA mutase [Bacteroidota bacterium]